jgi:hypothetical protein
MIIFALFLYSCRTTKQVQTAVDTTTPIELQQRPNFEWFSANFSGNINLSGDRNNISGQIRIKNGEQIWMTISAMGGFVPVANLKITTDSVFLHNRIERTATIRDFDFFKEITGVDITFDMLQDILLGTNSLPETNYEIQINYDNFAIFDDNLFPQSLFIQMKEPMQIELKLNYQKIQVNVPQNMQFSIPNSVKRI